MAKDIYQYKIMFGGSSTTTGYDRDNESDRLKLTCNFITLLAECMGDFKVIKQILEHFGEPPTEPLIVQRRGQIERPSNQDFRGLVAVGTDDAVHFHWRSDKDKELLNSYQDSLRWQKDGSNGFCQTFAMMGYLKDIGRLGKSVYPLLYNDPPANALSALQFIRDHCTPYIADVWEERCLVSKAFYDEHNLNATELVDDITSLITSKEGNDAIGLWLTHEIIYT